MASPLPVSAVNPPLGAIPAELLAPPQWVAWWSVVGHGRPMRLPNGGLTDTLKVQAKSHKLPINPHTGGLAASTRAATLSSVDDALAAVQQWALTGVGFVFTEDDPYCGIDIDKPRPGAGAAPGSPWALSAEAAAAPPRPGRNDRRPDRERSEGMHSESPKPLFKCPFLSLVFLWKSLVNGRPRGVTMPCGWAAASGSRPAGSARTSQVVPRMSVARRVQARARHAGGMDEAIGRARTSERRHATPRFRRKPAARMSAPAPAFSASVVGVGRTPSNRGGSGRRGLAGHSSAAFAVHAASMARRVQARGHADVKRRGARARSGLATQNRRWGVPKEHAPGPRRMEIHWRWPCQTQSQSANSFAVLPPWSKAWPCAPRRTTGVFVNAWHIALDTTVLVPLMRRRRAGRAFRETGTRAPAEPSSGATRCRAGSRADGRAGAGVLGERGGG
jgi:hypothetical protein